MTTTVPLNPSIASLSNATKSVGVSDSALNNALESEVSGVDTSTSSFTSSSNAIVANPIYVVANPVTTNTPAALSVSQLAQPGNYQTNSNEIWASADEVYASMGKSVPPSVDQRAEVRAILFAVQDAQQSGHNPVINNSLSLLDPSNIAAISAHVSQHMTGDNQAQLGGGKSAYDNNSTAAQSTIASVLTAYASRTTSPTQGSMSDDNGVMSKFTPSAGTGWNATPVSTAPPVTYPTPVTGNCPLSDAPYATNSLVQPQTNQLQNEVAVEINALSMNRLGVVNTDNATTFMAGLNDAIANGTYSQSNSPQQNAIAVYSAMGNYHHEPTYPSAGDVQQMLAILPQAYQNVAHNDGGVIGAGTGTMLAQLSPPDQRLADDVGNKAAIQGRTISTLDSSNLVAGLNDAYADGSLQGGDLTSPPNVFAVYSEMQKYKQNQGNRPGYSDVAYMLGLVQQSYGQNNLLTSSISPQALQGYAVQG